MGNDPTFQLRQSRVIPLYDIRVLNGQSDRNRTCDFLVPNQALYQTELHPEFFGTVSGFEPCPSPSQGEMLNPITTITAWYRTVCF